MPGIADTLAQLASRSAARDAKTGASRLETLPFSGSNPGALQARCHVPQGLGAHAPLVVVLHGCTQDAAAYDAGAGWSQMADRHGFAVLFPEQQRRNNPNLCFNWFSPEDSRRGSGEALSIRQMIAEMVERHAVDPARIYVTGLSAGGAMAAVMLATYPELFAGGAIIAGLPYGCAGSIPQALERMRGQGLPGAQKLPALVREASDHSGPWPKISIWQGSADTTVSPANAEAIVRQWTGVHGLDATPSRSDTVEGYPHRVWLDADGRDVVEAYSITGLGHGTPLATGGADGCGASGPHMIEAGISSTHRICAFWELAGDERRVSSTVPVVASVRPERLHGPESSIPQPERVGAGSAKIGKVIEDALRAAGLMR